MNLKNTLRLGLHLCGLGVMIAAMLLHPMAAQAASGLPNSSQFGYGALLNPLGDEVVLALKAAASIGLDWVGVEFDWRRLWRQEAAGPDLESIDAVIKAAESYDLDVMLSINSAPAWAKTSSGPDPEKTARLVGMLANRYSRRSFSIELFPAANTLAGWGAAPDPKAYTALLKASSKALHASGSSVLLVAAGLHPLPPDHSPADIDDLAYLSGLYESGAADYMPILGVRLTGISGEVMSPTDSRTPNVLRRYEALRQVMTSHQHANGIIWITGFTWPANKAASASEQSRWIRQAYNLLRTQLFIGAAFFDCLNPPSSGNPAVGGHYLIQTDAQKTRIHPALEAIGALITLDRTGQDISSRINQP